VPGYWEKGETQDLPVSRIKSALEKLIRSSFKKDGNISLQKIYSHLQEEYGFAPCNLYAFLTGFLLSEYGTESYRFADPQGGSGPMTPEHLGQMIQDCIQEKANRISYIVKMIPEKKSFYALCEKAWGIPADSCSSAAEMGRQIAIKMTAFGLPLWSLAEVAEKELHEPIHKFIELVQREGKEAHSIAVVLGKQAQAQKNLGEQLAALFTDDKVQEGMKNFVKTFEEGMLVSLADDIGASAALLSDIRELFSSVEHSCLWKKDLGEDEIRKLITGYQFVKESNSLLSVSKASFSQSCSAWRERLTLLRISHEVIVEKWPGLKDLVNVLLTIYQDKTLVQDQLKGVLPALKERRAEISFFLDEEQKLFTEVYKPYLEELSDRDIDELLKKLPRDMFSQTRTESNQCVRNAAEDYRKGLIKNQLFSLWQEKTGTKNPRDWSERHKIPILCCVDAKEYDRAVKCFDTLNYQHSNEADIKEALQYLEETNLFNTLGDPGKCMDAFVEQIIGEYATLLPDSKKVQEQLESILSMEVYRWNDHPAVKNKVRELAEAEYHAGGSDKVLSIIDGMDAPQLKEYLKRLIKDNTTVGMEILANKGD
jgi:hypothetical protein